MCTMYRYACTSCRKRERQRELTDFQASKPAFQCVWNLM